MLSLKKKRKSRNQVFDIGEWVQVCDYINDRYGRCLKDMMGKVVVDCSFLCNRGNAYRVRWAGSEESEVIYACHLERVL